MYIIKKKRQRLKYQTIQLQRLNTINQKLKYVIISKYRDQNLKQSIILQLLLQVLQIGSNSQNTKMDNNSDLYIVKSNFIQFRNDNIIDSYEFYTQVFYLSMQELGRGTYGVVYRAREKVIGGPWRAVKKIPKKLIKNQSSIKNQVQNLVRLDHPTILKIYEIYQDSNDIFLVTDLCSGGQLFQKLEALGSFSQRDTRVIFGQVLQALNYCHKKKVAHRDLKPENILFLSNHNMNLKLIDFGLSFKFQSEMRKQLKEKGDTKLVGTAYYMAPEIIAGSYDQRCDIWSAGVILYVMVTASPPFDGANDKEIMESVMKGIYSFDIPEMENVSKECKDLISRILVPDHKRLTIQQIFNHAWMKNELSEIPLQLNFKRLCEYSQYSKFKKIAANFIASKFSQRQIQGLSLIFKRIDTNNDGEISIEELKAALQAQHENKSYQELKEIMDGIDTDKNGSINYTEFVASSIDTSYIFTRENLYRVFKTIDKDGNGAVDINQLREILQKNNLSVINGKEIEEVMKIFDTNNDGKIDFNQFITAMTK